MRKKIVLSFILLASTFMLSQDGLSFNDGIESIQQQGPCDVITYQDGSVLWDCGSGGATLWQSPLPGGLCAGRATTCASPMTVVRK